MCQKKSTSLLVFIATAVLLALSVPGAFGQTAVPSASTSHDLTQAASQTPKPRAERFGLPDPPTARTPTHKEVAGLEAAMAWPGSILTGAAIMGNLAEASFLKDSNWSSMLATNSTGTWVKINQTDGCYTTDEIVQALQTISSCEAEEISVKNTLSRARWAEANTSRESTANVAQFNEYQQQGDVAASNGDFDAAIAAWTKAEALDHGDIKPCRGEFQRVQIRAAEHAEARMESLRLTKQEAARWFRKQESQLWTRSCCDLP
jgi:hypothetical protein